MKQINKVGVTGTRYGMNDSQIKNAVVHLKLFKNTDVELHHGDCIGVDKQIAKIAKYFNYKIICHPPLKREYRAFTSYDEIKKEFSHFQRNRNIVNYSDIILVIPLQNNHQNNGGTWYTFDYALKIKKPIILLTPDGNVKEFNNDFLL